MKVRAKKICIYSAATTFESFPGALENKGTLPFITGNMGASGNFLRKLGYQSTNKEQLKISL